MLRGVYPPLPPHEAIVAVRNVVETPRLFLRELGPADAPFVLHLLNEDGFIEFIGDKGVRSLDAARQYIAQGPVASYRRQGYGLYLTSLRADRTPLGLCGLLKRDALPDAEVGFAFLSQFRSKGYASEAAAAVLKYGHCSVGLARIVAVTAPENKGSVAVLRKIGLCFERCIQLMPDGPELQLYGPAPRSNPS